MTDPVEALRSAFNAEREPQPSKPIGLSTVRSALTSVADAKGHLLLVEKATPLTAEHARSLASSAAAHRRAARELDLIGAGVQEHVDNGFSAWRSNRNSETPIL
jgi:hypothetical protein